MHPKKKKPRESQWRVVNRCLNIMLRLLRSKTSNEELLAIIHADADDELTHSAATKRFEEDRDRLRKWFEVDLEYNRSSGDYTLIDVGRPLLDLPDDAVCGLAFLEQTFSDDSVPMQPEIQLFLTQVKMLLPKDTQRNINKQRGLLEIDLKSRDSDVINDDIFDAVQLTCTERRQLEFEYLSPQQDDRKIRIHKVEPLRYFFDTSRGHYYFEAFCIEARGPHGIIPQDQIITYRMGRMRNLIKLPKHFLHRRMPEYELDYVLNAKVTRLGVTEHFSKTQIFLNDDGSVTVRATSRNLFFDLRTLLHYGANCKVIGGEEAVQKMRKIVDDLSMIYEKPT